MNRTAKILSVFLLMLCLLGALTACGSKKDPNVSEKDGITFALDKEGKSYMVTDCDPSLTTVEIPATYNDLPVTVIDRNAFLLCTELTSVTLPDSIVTIGQNAFMWCTKLTNITLPSGVTTINKKAFYMSGLTDISVPDSVTKIGEAAFAGCSSLTSATVGTGVVDFSSNVFGRCTALESLTVPFIGSQMNFADTAHLGYLFGASSPDTNATWVPESLKTVTVTQSNRVEANAFKNCANLTDVILPDGLLHVGASAFEGCTGLSFTQHADALYLATEENPTYVLLKITNPTVTAFTLPSNTTVIASGAFSDCSRLQTITLTEGLHNISDAAFANCTALTAITIPEHVNGIGALAFQNCTSLKTVTVNSTELTHMSASAFDGCTALTYNTQNGAHYLGSQENPHLVLIKATGTDITACTIDKNTAVICQRAFAGCAKMRNVTFEETHGWNAGGFEIDAENLTDTHAASGLLVTTHANETWFRIQ